MTRFCAFALLVAVPLTIGLTDAQAQKDKDTIRIEGKLTKDDPKDKRRNGASQVHTVKMKAGKTYTIDMVSTELDSYLFLDDNTGKQLAEDDDSGGGTDAQIVFECKTAGDYRVVVTSFDAATTGDFTVMVAKK
jgi:hypothetical protein